MALALMEDVSRALVSEVAMLLLSSDPGSLSLLLFRWPAGCSLARPPPLG